MLTIRKGNTSFCKSLQKKLRASWPRRKSQVVAGIFIGRQEFHLNKKNLRSCLKKKDLRLSGLPLEYLSNSSSSTGSRVNHELAATFNEIPHQSGPPGLVGSAQPESGFPMKVFMKQP